MTGAITTSAARPRAIALAVMTLLVAIGGARLAAVDLRDVLADYTLTSWSRKDGLTGPVWAIAQDANGFLWLGNDDGLVRFDGIRFVVWNPGGALPKLPVRSIRVAADGSLWTGFGGTGGVARVAQRTVTSFVTDSAAPTGLVTAIVEDRAHTIWAASNTGLYRYQSARWAKVAADRGLPAGAITNAYVDSSGTLWVGTASGLFWRPEPTDDRFQQVEASSDPLRGLSLSEDRSGRIWTNDPVVGYRKIGDEPLDEAVAESGRGYRLIHDRQGNLWVGTIGQGLWRVRHPESGRAGIERTTVLSGLSSDAVRSVFEDRDGNIWAGTTEGVDRLMPHRVTPWTGLGLVSTIDVTRDDRMLVGTADGLLRFLRTAGTWEPDRARIPLVGVRSIRADPAGRVWALARDDLFRVVDGRPTHAALPTGSVPVDAIAAIPSGGLYAIARDGSVIRDNGTVASIVGHYTELDNARVTTALADRDGRLWVAYGGSSIGVLQTDGRFASYGAQQGVGGGPHYGLSQDSDGAVWIGGSDGLSRFAHDRFTNVTRASGLPQGGVYAVGDDDQRYLWLATGSGILRLAREEFDAAVANPQHQLRYRIYDTSDGLAGFPIALSDRSAVRAGDGSLWFITSRGISVVQPRALATSRPAPPVVIEAIAADDHGLDASSLDTLPPGTGKLQIEYTAPDVTTALKTRFRYKLDGFDADWVDAGARREALYRNLPPRAYTFRVAVTGDEGRWSDAEAVWAFSIQPRFYQTLWFYTLMAFAAAGLVYAAWALRLRQLRQQFALVLGERVRVSRELHDTLLQSLVGIALEFDVIAKTMDTAPESARDRIVKMRERVEEYIREARRSIWSLRSPALETRDLVAALRESGARAAAGKPVDFEFDVHGTPRRYTSNLEHQLLRIGQEAVLNAVRHASARTVKMTLQYSDSGVALRVADDGTGFEPTAAGHGTTDHYGITTMRERAEQVGGRVTISSRPNGGTVVEAMVPASASDVITENEGAA